MTLTAYEEDDLHVRQLAEQETSMSETSENWSEFKNPDGTVVKCLVNQGFLEWVVMEAPDGASLDLGPDHVDIKMIRRGLGFEVKLH